MWKKLHGPAPHENSVLVVIESESGCCGAETGTPAKYTATTDFATNIEGVQIGGTNYVFNTVATDEASLRDGIREAFIAADHLDVKSNGVRTEVNGANTTVSIYSTSQVNQLNLVGGGGLAVAQATTKYNLCEYVGLISGNPGNISVNGAAAAPLANVPYNYSTTDQAANEATRAQLQTDFAALVTIAVSVEVGVNVQEQGFDVRVNLPEGTVVEIGPAQIMTRNGCVEDYN